MSPQGGLKWKGLKRKVSAGEAGKREGRAADVLWTVAGMMTAALARSGNSFNVTRINQQQQQKNQQNQHYQAGAARVGGG